MPVPIPSLNQLLGATENGSSLQGREGGTGNLWPGGNGLPELLSHSSSFLVSPRVPLMDGLEEAPDSAPALSLSTPQPWGEGWPHPRRPVTRLSPDHSCSSQLRPASPPDVRLGGGEPRGRPFPHRRPAHWTQWSGATPDPRLLGEPRVSSAHPTPFLPALPEAE